VPNFNKDRQEWTAVFAAAADLRRRRYVVSIFLGRASSYDLLGCGEDRGQTFFVQIKANSQNPPKKLGGAGPFTFVSDLYTGSADTILAYVFLPPQMFEFYVATRPQLLSTKQWLPSNQPIPSNKAYWGVFLGRIFSIQGLLEQSATCLGITGAE
jgi:hypothetical protein